MPTDHDAVKERMKVCFFSVRSQVKYFNELFLRNDGFRVLCNLAYYPDMDVKIAVLTLILESEIYKSKVCKDQIIADSRTLLRPILEQLTQVGKNTNDLKMKVCTVLYEIGVSLEKKFFDILQALVNSLMDKTSKSMWLELINCIDVRYPSAVRLSALKLINLLIKQCP